MTTRGGLTTDRITYTASCPTCGADAEWVDTARVLDPVYDDQLVLVSPRITSVHAECLCRCCEQAHNPPGRHRLLGRTRR